MKSAKAVRRLRTGLAVAAWAFSVSAVLARENRIVGVLPVEKLMSATAVISSQISPDGRRVAVVTGVRTPGFVASASTFLEDAFTEKIEVLDTESQETIKISTGSASQSHPVWSPDGKKLAFFAGHEDAARLWVLWIGSRRLHQLTANVIPQMLAPKMVWTPDSRTIVLSAVPNSRSNSALRRQLIATPSLADTAYPLDVRVPGARVAVYRSSATQGSSGGHSEASGTTENDRDKTAALYTTDIVVVSTEGNVRRLVVGRRPIFWQLSPDGKHIGFGDLRSIDKSTARARVDLLAADITSGALQEIVSHIQLSTAELDGSWAPDSHNMAFCDTYVERIGTLRCYLVDMRNGGVRAQDKSVSSTNDIRGESFAKAPMWDPTGKQFYAPVYDRDLRQFELGVVSADSLLSRRVPFPEKRAQWPTLPLSGRDGQLAVKVGNELILRTLNPSSKEAGFYALDVVSGGSRQLYEGAFSIGTEITVDADAKNVAYTEERADVPPEVWVSDPRFRVRRMLSHYNTELRNYGLGHSRLIQWRGVAGDELRGALLLPSDYDADKRYPMIVDFYLLGGSGALNHFGLIGLGSQPGSPLLPVWENLQLLASRGYVILVADTEAHVGRPMADIAENLMPGINETIDQGIADPDRLAVMGHSYGGYGVLSVLVQSKRFKAAVVMSGPVSMIGPYSNLFPDGTAPYAAQWLGSKTKPGQGRMSGSLWDFRSEYIENSPLFYLDRVTTPILAMYGDIDRAVPIQEGDELFVSLRALGKDVEYARYVGESHVVYGWANSIDYAQRMITWFDQHLDNKPTH